MTKLRLVDVHKQKLLKTARLIIQKELGQKLDEKLPDLNEAIFLEKYGLFVTLSIEGHLRGCIGYVKGVAPIREAVAKMAVEAAFHDPRFSPLTVEEFERLELEISILYPLEEVSNIDQIKVGRDGLVMSRGFQSGLLLPQVPVEWKWDLYEFLNQTCRKAGMEKECWKNGAKIQKFEAEVFSEKDFK